MNWGLAKSKKGAIHGQKAKKSCKKSKTRQRTGGETSVYRVAADFAEQRRAERRASKEAERAGIAKMMPQIVRRSGS
jgi:hypothetical protein